MHNRTVLFGTLTSVLSTVPIRYMRLGVLLLLITIGISGVFAGETGTQGPFLTALTHVEKKSETVKSWSMEQVKSLKKASSHERDPKTGQVVRWDGVLLSTVVDSAMEGMPAEKKALIDLIILKNASGAQALIPRAFVVKYPILLAMKRAQSDLGPLGPLYSVVPWTSKAKIMKESVPLEHFFIPGIHQIQLTNYRELYSQVYLKRRGDPAAIRGEKLFVQNCISCHAAGQGPGVQQISSTRAVASSGLRHPKISSSLNLTEKDWRFLESYVAAHRSESNPDGASAVSRNP